MKLLILDLESLEIYYGVCKMMIFFQLHSSFCIDQLTFSLHCKKTLFSPLFINWFVYYLFDISMNSWIPTFRELWAFSVLSSCDPQSAPDFDIWGSNKWEQSVILVSTPIIIILSTSLLSVLTKCPSLFEPSLPLKFLPLHA